MLPYRWLRARLRQLRTGGPYTSGEVVLLVRLRSSYYVTRLVTPGSAGLCYSVSTRTGIHSPEWHKRVFMAIFVLIPLREFSK